MSERDELMRLVAEEFHDEVPDYPADDALKDFPWRDTYQSIADRILAAGYRKMPSQADLDEIFGSEQTATQSGTPDEEHFGKPTGREWPW